MFLYACSLQNLITKNRFLAMPWHLCPRMHSLAFTFAKQRNVSVQTLRLMIIVSPTVLNQHLDAMKVLTVCAAVRGYGFVVHRLVLK